MKIIELQKGDKICALERHRRTLSPMLDIYRIVEIGQPKMERVGDTFSNVAPFTLEDETGYRFQVTLEVEKDGSICDRVYYTPNLTLVIQEVLNTKQQAESILNNKGRYEQVVADCEDILTKLGYNEQKQETQEAAAPITISEIKKQLQEEMKPYLEMTQKIYESLQQPVKKEEGKAVANPKKNN